MNKTKQTFVVRDAMQAALRHHQKGELRQAESIYLNVLRFEPDNADALHLLGVIAHQAGNDEAAIGYIEKAIRSNKRNPFFHYNAGVAYRALNRLDEAIASYRRAISLKPDYHEAHYNLGNALNEQNRFDEAEASYRRAISLKPDYHEAHNNLGNALNEQDRLDEAEASYRRAISLKPDYHEAHYNLGIALNKQNRFDEAETCYRRAISLKPDYHEAHYSLGNTLRELGKTEEAKEYYLKALALKPDDKIRIKLATLLPVIMPSGEAIIHCREQFEQGMNGLLESGIVLDDPVKYANQNNFYLAYHGLNNRGLQSKTADFYAKACPSLLYEAPHCKGGSSIRKSGKIKIGFVSRHFFNHTISKHFRGIIAGLSRELFDVHVFFVKRKYDAMARSIEKNADRPVNLKPDLETARRQIAECGLDILFYTDIGMEPVTYFLAFSRLAPVQCVTWGHPDTTGIPNMDYYISFEDFEPEGAEAQYSETLIRMKNIPNYFYRPDAIQLSNAPEIRKKAGLPGDKRLYAVPQSLVKIHPDFDAVMGEILRRDSEGLLVLFDDRCKYWSKLLMERFSRSFPDAACRVISLPRLPFNDFLSLMRSVDAVLDTPHFCGGTTSLEMFSVGCPVVAWPGSRMASRFTYGYYRKMGIMDLVADNGEQYVQLALRLACDEPWREEIRAKILDRRGVFYENMDAVRELERFFRRVGSGA